MVKGNAKTTAMFLNICSPPIQRKRIAFTTTKIHQKARFQMVGSPSPPMLNLPSTWVAELTEVMIKVMISTMDMGIVIAGMGNPFKKMKREFSIFAAAIFATSLPPNNVIWIAPPPKKANHKQQRIPGTKTDAKTNSRIVRPFDISARKPPTKGTKAIHQAQ